MSVRDHQFRLLPGVILPIVLLCLFAGKAVAAMPLVPLLLLIGIFIFYGAFAYPNFALVLLIVAMLLSPEFILGALSKQRDIAIRMDDLLIVVFMMAWLARSALNKNIRLITKTPINFYIGLYCFIFIVSTTKSMITGDVSPVKGSFYIFKYIEYFAVFYLVAGTLRDKSQVERFLKAFFLVFAVVNIYAFLQIPHTERVSAPFEGTGEPNTLGGYQVFMLAILLGVLTHARLGPWKWPLIMLAVFTLIPFAHTLSRSSYLAIIPMYLTLIMFNKVSTRTALIVVLMAFIIALIFYFPENVQERIQYTFTPEQLEDIPPVEILGVHLDPSASARIWDWVHMYEAWKKHPFIGYGVTGKSFLDSQYVLVLTEMGLVGLTAFLLLVGNIFRYALRHYHAAKDGLLKGVALGFLAGHVGLLFHAISANTFIVIRIMEPYWFLAAVVMMIPYIERESEKIEVEPGKPVSMRNSDILLNGRKKA